MTSAAGSAQVPCRRPRHDPGRARGPLHGEADAAAARLVFDLEIERLKLKIACLPSTVRRTTERDAHIEQPELRLAAPEETAAAAETVEPEPSDGESP